MRLHGDPKVVAALAVAILAVPPVVNAIMTKAAEQADTEWLRDQPLDLDFDGDPPDGTPPDGGPREGEGPTPRPPPPPPVPCRPTLDGDPVPVGGPVAPDATGTLTADIRPGDLAVVVDIRGQAVTGTVAFALREDGQTQWQNDASQLHVREDFQYPPRDQAIYPQPTPGTTWELTYDVSRAAFDGVVLTLAVQRCVEAAP